MTKDVRADIKAYAKRKHAQEASRALCKNEYTCRVLEKSKIAYCLINDDSGLFHIHDKKGKQYQYLSGSGRIVGYEKQGIFNLISILKEAEDT